MGQPPTVRPELAALLATVRANPEEDTPRLVLDDWLDENDNTRDARLAALIRSQIAMPTRVERRETELRELFPALPWADEDFEGSLVRGALHGYTDAAVFRSTHQPLVDSEDWLWVEALTVAFEPVELFTEIVASPLLRTVPFPEFIPPIGDELDKHISRWTRLLDEYLPDLVSLALFRGSLRPAGFRALCTWPRFAQLRHLSLSFAPIGDEGVFAWRDGGPHPRLDTLDLSQCGLSSAGLTALAQMPNLDALRELNISAHDLREPNAGVFAPAVFRDALRVLRWRSGVAAHVDNALETILRALFAGGPWAALETLDLTRTFAADENRDMVGAYLHPEHLPRLHTLCCETSWVDASVFRVLADNGLLAQLKSLSLSGSFDDGVVAELAHADTLSGLEVLTINSPCVERGGKDGWDALTKAEVFRSLHRLSIHDTATFTADHAKRLVDSPHFPALEVVGFGGRVKQSALNILRSRFVVWG